MNARTIKRSAEKLNDNVAIQLLTRGVVLFGIPIALSIMWNTYNAIDALKLSNNTLVQQVAEAERNRAEDLANYERRFAELRESDRDLWRAIRSVSDRMGR